MERALGSRYTLGEPLGRGAMGEVFAGTDTDGTAFAFKVLRGDLTGDPTVVTRFLQERSILVGLRHPNLVTVHDLVVEGTTVAIVMDLVEGGDLRSWLQNHGTLLPAEVARIGAAVASALAPVHAAGVVHRDVKPANVLMDSTTAERTPRLTDFGISKLVDPTKVASSTHLAGTPQYVAPELATGVEPTAAADLYSLGIMLYELCCGVTPFAGNTVYATIKMHAEAQPGRPNGIPEPLWQMISWLLQKTPRARPQSAQDVAVRLEALVGPLMGAPVADLLTTPPPPIPIRYEGTTAVGMVPTNGPLATTPPATPVRRKRRKVIPIALALVVLGVGGTVAWSALNPTHTEPAASTTGASVAPATGQQAGASSSATTSTTTTTSEPQLTEAPNLVGKKLAEAQDMLPHSIRVEIVDSIEQTAAPGTVVEQSPKPGEKLTGQMKLTVARDAVQIYLDELASVNGRWSSDAQARTIAGKTYPHTVSSDTSAGSRLDGVEYNIAKGFRRLVATAGLDDNSPDSSLKVQLEIFGDNRKLASTVLEYGKPADISADVSGVLRLKIQWQPVGGDRNICCGNNYVSLGEAKLLGLPGEVPSSGASASGSTTTSTR